MHVDPLLAEYTSLAQVIYKKYTPPEGEITPDTLPGFRKSKAITNLAQVRTDILGTDHYKNVPANFICEKYV